MKNQTVSLIIAVIFTAFSGAVLAQTDVSSQPQVLPTSVVTAKALKPYLPPKTFQLKEIEANSLEMDYNISFDGERGWARLSADASGKLVAINVVVNDTTIDCLRLNTDAYSRDGDVWSHAVRDSDPVYTIDPKVWTKFFDEKVAINKVTIKKSPVIIVELEHNGNQNPCQYEFVGSSYVDRGVMIHLRIVGTTSIKSFKDSDFLTTPPENRPFYLGTIDGRYCAVESVVTGANSKVFAVAVRVDEAKPVTSN